MEENFTYNLKKLLKYTPKGSGDFSETGAIEFTPPSMAVFDEAADFEQIIMSSMMSAAKLGDVEEKKEEGGGKMEIPTPGELRVAIHAGTVPVKKIAELFRKLAYKTGYLDENTLIKKSHFQKMDRDDFLDMMCGYASFFTFPSLLRGD